MEFVMPILEGAWRYVLTLRISDYLDIALMAYAIYWLLKLVGTSKVESVGKVIPARDPPPHRSARLEPLALVQPLRAHAAGLGH